MLKKFLLSLFFLSSILGLSAQHVPGSWKVIPMTGTTFDFVQDTPSMVYYVSGGSLYGYDKDSNETVYFAPGSRISDSGVKNIYYNSDKRYLLVVFDNSNIDLIYDNGKVVNLPEIKDANLTSAKKINNVKFGKDRILVAAEFGIVIYDDNDHHVIESGIYNESIPLVFQLGDNLILVRKNANSYQLSASSIRDRHNTVDKFVNIGELPSLNDAYTLSENQFISLNDKEVNKNTVDFSAKTLSSDKVKDVPAGKPLKIYGSGYYLTGDTDFYLFGTNGNFVNSVSFPAEFGKQILSFWNSPSSVWVADNSGIGNYNLTSSTPTVISEKYFPESSKQYDLWFSANHPNGKEVYIGQVGATWIHPGKSYNDNYYSTALTESYDWNTGEIIPRYPVDDKGNLVVCSPGRFLFDPEDPSYMYYATSANGLMVVKDGKVHAVYNDSNSPIYTGWYTRLFDLSFDSNGNLWTIGYRALNNTTKSVNAPVKILPKESLDIMKKNPKEIEKFENNKYVYWLEPQWVDGKIGFADVKIKFSKNSKYPTKGIASNNPNDDCLIGIDTKGTTRIDDDVYQLYNSLVDQDGNKYKVEAFTWFEEDKNGHFWLGTNQGVFILKDLEQIGDRTDDNLNVVKPKVARNDGTDYADYLLASDFIMNIAVDANNRKWIATKTSGLYYVNEDGTEILQAFNKDNTPLVSNIVTMAVCDPNGNDVLIATTEGIFIYSSDSAPARDDYSEVYAFPNPVRPDYTGWITINGLMDNSLVKITDAHGNMVWQDRSEGGMAVWDGCDTAGNRVRSGVYLVFASQNSTGKSSGAVTKIVVIN